MAWRICYDEPVNHLSTAWSSYLRTLSSIRKARILRPIWFLRLVMAAVFSLSGCVDQQGYSNASIQQVVASADSVELQIDLNDACNAANVRHTVDETAQEIRILVDVLNPGLLT